MTKFVYGVNWRQKVRGEFDNGIYSTVFTSEESAREYCRKQAESQLEEIGDIDAQVRYSDDKNWWRIDYFGDWYDFTVTTFAVNEKSPKKTLAKNKKI